VKTSATPNWKLNQRPYHLKNKTSFSQQPRTIRLHKHFGTLADPLPVAPKQADSHPSSVSRSNNVPVDNDHRHKATADRLIVVGSGVAGCSTALIAAELYKIPVTVVFAGGVPTDCNSYWAQGGIIYRNYDSASGDCAELLSQDIHKAGAGLCQDDAVWKVATEGPDRVRQLLLNHQESKFANVPFDINPKTNELSLCLEASHAAPRILHKADHTGATITQHITAAAAAHPLISFRPHTVVTDLIVHNDTCVGIESLDRLSGTIEQPMYTNIGVVLASGGLAGIYEHSTNPAGFNALGSSVALATRASAKTQDLEFVQFHPTALYIPGEARFLLTEALRGEGAILRDGKGRAFAQEYHPDAELAPRDIVARAVFSESQKGTTINTSSQPDQQQQTKANVFLDITHRDASWLHQRFPTIHSHLQQRGYDLARDLLPIIPAAHYTCGGITTDLHGRTSVRGLYAAGEAARTGLHGGNRLASTSLLEGLVFGASVADFLGSDEGRSIASDTSNLLLQQQRNTYYDHKRGRYDPQNSTIVPPHHQEPHHIENTSHRAMKLLTLLRKVMWDYVGVVRTPSGLEAASELLQDIQAQSEILHQQCPTLETAAVRDAATAGYAVAQAAKANPNSIGAHCIIEDVLEEESEEEDEVAEMR
jgi:L-aspartate oxidase